MSTKTRTQVNGLCPFGCGPHLCLTHDGLVICIQSGCPDSEAVTKILNDKTGALRSLIKDD